MEACKAAASRDENPTRTSKLPSERVVLLVLGSLLAAALIIICRLSFALWETNQMVQTLEEENEALKEENGELRRNISDEICWKCEAGWELHGGKCYYFSTNEFSWKESRRLCKDLGGDLVKIDSREEQIFFKEKLVHMMKNDEDKFWIGLTDSEEEGRWLWADGSPLNRSLSFWTDGQPDNWSKSSLKQADCVRMGQIGASDVLKSWFDMSCDAHQKRICEKAEKTR